MFLLPASTTFPIRQHAELRAKTGPTGGFRRALICIISMSQQSLIISLSYGNSKPWIRFSDRHAQL